MCASEKPLRLVNTSASCVECGEELSSLSDEDLLAFLRKNRQMIEDLYEHLANLNHGYMQLFYRDYEYDRFDVHHSFQAKRRRRKAQLQVSHS